MKILFFVFSKIRRGVCEENLGELLQAIESYKQANWFAFKYLKEYNPAITQFLFDVEKRTVNYNKLILNMRGTDYKIAQNEKESQQKTKKYFNEEIDYEKKLVKQSKKLKIWKRMKLNGQKKLHLIT